MKIQINLFSLVECEDRSLSDQVLKLKKLSHFIDCLNKKRLFIELANNFPEKTGSHPICACFFVAFFKGRWFDLHRVLKFQKHIFWARKCVRKQNKKSRLRYDWSLFSKTFPTLENIFWNFSMRWRSNQRPLKMR